MPQPLGLSASAAPGRLLASVAGLADSGIRGAELRAEAAGVLAQALGMLSPGAVAGDGLVSVSACPSIPNIPGLAIPGMDRVEAAVAARIPELSLGSYRRGIVVATFAQGSLGMLRILLGDKYGGLYQLLLATLGYNARHPGSGASSSWLKTYVLITFINGTMSTVDLFQNIMLHNYPVLLLSLPLKVNLAHALLLVVPAASFLGAYCGWQYLKQQKKYQLMAYNAQIMDMMAKTPWPPPLLQMQGTGPYSALPDGSYYPGAGLDMRSPPAPASVPEDAGGAPAAGSAEPPAGEQQASSSASASPA